MPTACSSPPPPAPPAPLWSADWQKSYTQVRNCRHSIDHDLNYVTVWTDAATGPYYTARNKPFPDGALVLKVEYEDEMCTMLAGFTAMHREQGFDPQNGDWHWQKADQSGTVTLDGQVPRCSSCHKGCGVPPTGFDWTCSAVSAN